MSTRHAYKGADIAHEQAEDWRAQAACRDMPSELWFHDDFAGAAAQADTAEAQRICAGCDVREQCLNWALSHNEPWGVWGGLTADERGGGARTGRCRTCPEPIPEGSEARYCPACRAKARARQNRSRAKKKEVVK